MQRRTGARALAALFAMALFAASCGDSGSSSGESSDATTTTVQETPVSGGTTTMAVFTETAGLDPIVSSGNGTTGGTEMLNVYDSVMEWNPDTKKTEPRTAQSLTPNSDFTEWTLKVRSGIKFTDGTAYDAAAVKFSLDRHKSPANVTSSSGYMQLMKEATVVDALTLKIVMTASFPGFPAILADEPGMVPSPTAVQTICGTTAPRSCDFNLKPVGAGPFMIDGSFKKGEALTLKRNPDYWGGPAYLDSIKFVFINGGAQPAYDALKSNTVQVAYLREPAPIDQAKKDKIPGLSTIINNGASILLNQGFTITCSGGKPATHCTGKADGEKVEVKPATADLKVRQAVAAAINPQTINERAYEGKGLPGTELLQKEYAYYPGPNGFKYDPEAAKKLVAEAKAAGWNGKLKYVGNNVPVNIARAQTVKAMLEAVGITVDLETSKSTADQVQQIITEKDFDLAIWGSPAITDDDLVWPAINQALSSTSAGNRSGLKSPEMDAALAELKVAATTETRTAAWKKITDAYLKGIPWVVEGAVEEYIAFRPEVRGLRDSIAGDVQFAKAWIKK